MKKLTYSIVTFFCLQAIVRSSDECKSIHDSNPEKFPAYAISNNTGSAEQVVVESSLEGVDGKQGSQETSQYEIKAHSVKTIPAYAQRDHVNGEIDLLCSKITIGKNILETQSTIVGSPSPVTRNNDCLIGMNCHLSRYNAQDQWRLLQMMRDAGITTVRLENDFSSPGSDNKFVFDPKVDEALLGLEAFNMRPLMVLAYFPNAFYQSPTKAQMAYDWAKAVGEHYRGRVFDWEYGNETNAGWGGFGAAADMAAHNQAMALGSLAADPGNTPSTFGIAEGLPNYLNELFRCGLSPYVGAVCLHPYCGISESGISKLLSNREIIKTFGGNQEIWATEIGFNYAAGGVLNPTTKQLTQLMGFTLEQQADMIARLFILGKATDIQRIYWYDFSGKNDPETLWLVDDNFQPRPAYNTLKYVAALLKDAKSLGGTEPTELVQKHLFQGPNGSTFLVVWALTPGIKCDLHLPNGQYSVANSSGTTLDVNVMAPVELGETPLIIQKLPDATQPFLAKEILVNALDQRSWNGPLHRWTADAGQTISVPCVAFNSTHSAVSLSPCVLKSYPNWSIDIPQSFQVNAGETTSREFKVTIPKDAVPGVEYRLLFAAEMAGPRRTTPYEARIWVNGKFPYSQYLSEGAMIPDYPVRRVIDEANVGFGRPEITAKKSSVTIDGDLSDWSPDEFVSLDQVGAWLLRDAGHPAREDWFAKAAVRWDDNYLYVAFIVLDDDVSCLDLVSRDWRDADNVRIFLSTETPEKRQTTITDKDFLIFFSPTRQGGDEAPAVMSASIGGYVHEGLESRVRVRSRIWEGGYLIESAIPFSELKIRPQAGLTLGCNLLGDDSDKGFRRSTGMTTYKSHDYWNNPQTLGVLRLLP